LGKIKKIRLSISRFVDLRFNNNDFSSSFLGKEVKKLDVESSEDLKKSKDFFTESSFVFKIIVSKKSEKNGLLSCELLYKNPIDTKKSDFQRLFLQDLPPEIEYSHGKIELDGFCWKPVGSYVEISNCFLTYTEKIIKINNRNLLPKFGWCKYVRDKIDCPYKKNCNFAHNESEIDCKNWCKKGECSFGRNCKYAHVVNKKNIMDGVSDTKFINFDNWGSMLDYNIPICAVFDQVDRVIKKCVKSREKFVTKMNKFFLRPG